MTDEEDIGIGAGEAWEIAGKIVEMCERVRTAHAVVPGAAATWGLELDGREYCVRVTCK